VLEQRGKDESASRGGWGSDFWPGVRQLLEGAAFRAGLMGWEWDVMGSGGKRNWVGGRRTGAQGLEWRGEVGKLVEGDDDPIAQPLSKLKYQSWTLFFFFEESH